MADATHLIRISNLENRMRFADRLPFEFGELLRDEAGASLMETALVGFLILIIFVLLLLAWRRKSQDF